MTQRDMSAFLLHFQMRPHCFREGKGRSTRIWLDAILKKELGQVIDWSKIDKEDYLFAMERSPVRNKEIMMLLKLLKVNICSC